MVIRIIGGSERDCKGISTLVSKSKCRPRLDLVAPVHTPIPGSNTKARSRTYGTASHTDEIMLKWKEKQE
jgi:hypothetical protein